MQLLCKCDRIPNTNTALTLATSELGQTGLVYFQRLILVG